LGAPWGRSRIEKAQIERELLESQLRQSQKMEAIGTFSRRYRHDFNNIWARFWVTVNLRSSNLIQAGPVRRYIDNVMHAAGRAKLLVDRILGFSRSGLGERTQVHIQSVVEETLETARCLLAPRHPAGRISSMPVMLH